MSFAARSSFATASVRRTQTLDRLLTRASTSTSRRPLHHARCAKFATVARPPVADMCRRRHVPAFTIEHPLLPCPKDVIMSWPVTQRVDHQGKCGRGLPAAWIEQVVAGIGLAPIIKHPPQSAPGHIRLHHTLGRIDQAQAG